MTGRRTWRSPLRPPAGEESRLPGHSRVIKQVLYTRGVTTRDDANHFFARGLAGLHPARDLPGVEPALERLLAARSRREEVCVFGDYDADGVCGTAILMRALPAAGISTRWYLPSRSGEGYGMNPAALAELHRSGVTLVISVDNGVSAVVEAEAARDMGLDLIITDHHLVGPELPWALAIVHPALPGSTYPFPHLCGAGVALKLALALLDEVGADVPEVRDELLALAAIGTVADVVSLVGENRRIVAQGLDRINRRASVGVAALMRASSLPAGTVDAEAIGYRLGPRLNAAGRMADATAAVRLLLTNDPAEAAELATQLERHNQERRRETDRVLAEARTFLGEMPTDRVLCIGDPGWPVGLVGLVASRLVELHSRPAFVMQAGDEVWRGSVRWPYWWPLGAHHALAECHDLLSRYGGHRAAGGFSVPAESVEAFRRRLQELAGLPTGADLLPELAVDAEVDAAELDADLRRELDLLAPFGAGNPEPVLALRGVRVGEVRPVGDGRHLRLSVRGRMGALHGVAFDSAERLSWLSAGTSADIAFSLGWNTFQEMRTLELRLIDLRPAGIESD